MDVATNARGDTVATWLRNVGGANYTVQAAFRPAGGSFGPPQDIGATTACFFVALLGPTPDVAIDADGGAAIVYLAPGAASVPTVRAAIKPPGGAFGAPVDLSDDVRSADAPRVAMNPSGFAVAVWEWDDGANDVIQVATRQPGGAFQTSATPLSAAGAPAATPDVAVNEAGAAVTTWSRSNGTVDIVQARVKPAGTATFSPFQDLSATGAVGQDAAAPDAAIEAGGNSTVVWTRDDGTRVRLQARNLNAAGVAAAGTGDVSGDGEDALNPALALDPAGNAVVVYGSCPAGTSTNCSVRSASRPAGGSFGAVQTISAAGDQAFSPRVVMDAAGVATAVFSPLSSTDIRVLMTRRPPGGTFGAVEPLSTGGTNILPAAAVDDQGNVVAAWAQQSGGSGTPYFAQVAVYDNAAPSLDAVSVPASGTAGAGVGMAAAATDRWSPVAINWSFGDGGTASGGAVTHAFGAAGAFTVTVAASDAVGNAVSATRPIVISPKAPKKKKRISSKVRVTWGVAGKKIFLLRLSASGLPKGAKMELRCKGKKCRKTVSSKKRKRGTITLFKEIKASKVAGKKARTFRAGQRLEVRITAPKHIGKVVQYKLKAGKIPSGKNLCLPIGKKTPRKRCS